MRKLIAFSVTLLLLVGISVAACAQDSAKMEQGLQIIGLQLGLSDAQKQQLREAGATFHASALQIKNSSLSDMEKGQAMKSLVDGGMSAFISIFTPEQIDKALDLAAGYMKLADAKPAVRVGAKAAQAAAKAGLTQDQQKALAAAYAAHCSQAKAVINDSSLTADQKNEKLWELRQQNAAAAAAFLNAEQQIKAGLVFQGGRDSYMKFRNLLTPSQGQKLDNLISAAFAIAEQKLILE